MNPIRSNRAPILVSSLAALAFGVHMVALPSVTSAATEEEWEAFRTDVADKCTVAAEGLFETMEILVDPFGSEHYGLALIRGTALGADVEIAVICVYDKEMMTAEIGSELPNIVWTEESPVLGP